MIFNLEKKMGFFDFLFRKGNKSFAEECGLENPNGIEDRSASLQILIMTHELEKY